MFVKVIRTADGAVLGDRIRIADTFLTRLRGLMLHPPLQPGEGLIIEPCSSIHMMFMRFPIDAVFLDAEHRVIASYHHLRPWIGISAWHRRSVKVIELPAGTLVARGIIDEDTLILEYSE